MAKILERYWFSGVRRYVRQHVRACIECLVNKVPGGKKAGLLHPIPVTRRPFERIHVDNLGPFLKSSRGYEYIMVCIDSFTRYVMLYPLKNIKGIATIKAMEDLVLRFGNPRVIVTDRRTCFTSKGFKNSVGLEGFTIR